MRMKCRFLALGVALLLFAGILCGCTPEGSEPTPSQTQQTETMRPTESTPPTETQQPEESAKPQQTYSDLQFREVEEELDFTTAWDMPDTRPILVNYLLDDQSTVKGNVIVIAGGANVSRANQKEGYPVAEKFNELGYNAYVLQRRVEPYNTDDIYMDLQRSIRYIRYYADEYGIGGLDRMVAVGFSGGAGTISGQVAYHAGMSLPSEFASDYQDDEVDKVNSDLDVALLIYGGVSNTEDLLKNPNLPAFFLAAGSEDNTGAQRRIPNAFLELSEVTEVEAHIFFNAPHGFGVGIDVDQGPVACADTTNILYWPEMADGFIIYATDARSAGEKEALAAFEDAPSAAAELGLTKAQTFTYPIAGNDTEVFCAIDDAESRFMMMFVSMGQTQQITGTLSDGAITDMEDDSNISYFGINAQNILNIADPDKWETVGAPGGDSASVIPAEYTKSQVYPYTLAGETFDVTCAVDDAETKFYITFTFFGDEQIITGTLDNGTVTVETDKTGFVGKDAQSIYSASRTTGNCAMHQRQLTTAIKQARQIALLPYVTD